MECVKALLGAGAHVNATMANGATALFIATLHGQAETVRVLLQYRHHPRHSSSHGSSSSSSSDSSSSHGSSSSSSSSSSSGSNSSSSSGGAQGSMVDTNASTQDGCTPLFVGCWHGHYECVDLLLQAGI